MDTWPPPEANVENRTRIPAVRTQPRPSELREAGLRNNVGHQGQLPKSSKGPRPGLRPSSVRPRVRG